MPGVAIELRVRITHGGLFTGPAGPTSPTCPACPTRLTCPACPCRRPGPTSRPAAGPCSRCRRRPREPAAMRTRPSASRRTFATATRAAFEGAPPPAAAHPAWRASGGAADGRRRQRGDRHAPRPTRDGPRPTIPETNGRAGSRSASALVSSMKLPKLAMNGTLSSASRARQPGGVANTGFGAVQQQHLHGRSVRRKNIGHDRVQRPTRVRARSRVSATGKASCGMNETPPGSPTLPSSAFSALTASAANRPLVCASGAPPMMATAGRCSTSSRASAFDASGGDAGPFLDVAGRVAGETRAPAVDQARRRGRRRRRGEGAPRA